MPHWTGLLLSLFECILLLKCLWRPSQASLTDNSEKSVGASTHPCLTPLLIEKFSDTEPLLATLAYIPVWSASIRLINFSVQPYFLGTCQSPCHDTVSKALPKSMKTTESGMFCSIHFSWAYLKQKIRDVFIEPVQKYVSENLTNTGQQWYSYLGNLLNLPCHLSWTKTWYLLPSSPEVLFGLLISLGWACTSSW